MVVPVGEGNVQQMRKITKLSEGVLREEIFDEFSFVPMLVGKES
jgi:protein-L-isoaspartate(D-aspartate) O-methyltransferase